MKRILLIIVSVLFFFSFLVSRALAQYDIPSIPSLIPGFEEQISVHVNPENPGPNQNVSISLEAFGTDLNRATISWLLNNKVSQSGVGIITYNFNTGKIGSVSDITILILPVNGIKITKRVVINPGNIDLVWEADSYVPPFYNGKKLHQPEGNLTFVALPNLVLNGVRISPQNLIYTWSQDDEILGDRSGYGKNTLTVSGDVLNHPVNISVKANSIKNEVVGEGAISVGSVNPQVLLYENNPLYGVLFNNALRDQFALKETEFKLSAYPYYFSTNSPSSSSLKYQWAINNSSINTLSANQNSVVFRKPDGIVEGQSLISTDVLSNLTFLQEAANNLMISFGLSNNVTF